MAELRNRSWKEAQVLPHSLGVRVLGKEEGYRAGGQLVLPTRGEWKMCVAGQGLAEASRCSLTLVNLLWSIMPLAEDDSR